MCLKVVYDANLKIKDKIISTIKPVTESHTLLFIEQTYTHDAYGTYLLNSLKTYLKNIKKVQRSTIKSNNRKV